MGELPARAATLWRSWVWRMSVLALWLVIGAWLLPAASEVRQDDDVLAFLPPEHADVVAFRSVAERFGMLDVALVGLTAPDGGDFFDPAAVEAVRRLEADLQTAPGVRMVLSFVGLPDPHVTDDGLEVGALVPASLTDADAIRARVEANADAIGNFIAADGRAAALLVYLVRDREGLTRSEVTAESLAAVKAKVRDAWAGTAYYGGAPFIERAAAETSRGDMERLSPIVIAVLLTASGVLLRSLVAGLLNFGFVALGVGLVIGAHARFGVPLSLVSSTLPVMLVALGGALGVHILAGYQRHRGEPPERVAATVRELWLPVLLSGVTTSAAFFALWVMPQAPMKSFAVGAGLGVLALLALALTALPAVLASLPASWIGPRTEARGVRVATPPRVLLAALALLGALAGTSLRAEVDTAAVFAEDSEPRRGFAFFDQHFGGSAFLQVAVQADLGEPTVLRRITTFVREVRQIEGVADARSLAGPVAVLNAALGGRKGVPETPARARRVLSYLVAHPAMAQLMTSEADGALIHIKLRPQDGEQQRAVSEAVRARVAELGAALVVAPTERRQRQVRVDVAAAVSAELGRPISPEQISAPARAARTPAVRAMLAKLRDRALASDDSPVEGVPVAEIQALDPWSLLEPRGEALAQVLRDALPTLAASDPEGIGFVAEHLGPWIDEAMVGQRAQGRCLALGIDDEAACTRVLPVLSELDDAEWGVREGEGREIPLRATLTGQPVLGAAFAQSVTDALLESTAASLAALCLVLALSRLLGALLPALWALAVTAGAIAVLGHSISVGTSMVFCIALGAGVDFGIHLAIRARRRGRSEAVEALGRPIVVSGVELAAAFAVLLASGMPPLREFASGLAIALLAAAFGSVWWFRPRAGQSGE